MPITGYIDGNAPPFIVLILAFAGLAILINTFPPIYRIHSGVRFKIIARRLYWIGAIFYLLLFGFGLARVVMNGYLNIGKILGNDVVIFWKFDTILLALLWFYATSLFGILFLVFIYERHYRGIPYAQEEI